MASPCHIFPSLECSSLHPARTHSLHDVDPAFTRDRGVLPTQIRKNGSDGAESNLAVLSRYHKESTYRDLICYDSFGFEKKGGGKGASTGGAG